jgi:hypothetical protein
MLNELSKTLGETTGARAAVKELILQARPVPYLTPLTLARQAAHPAGTPRPFLSTMALTHM